MAGIVSITESALIGIHGLVVLAQNTPGQVSTKSISAVTGASENTVSKVMQRLLKEGFVTSNRGPSGGFSLAKSARVITLLDIYEAIEGRLDTSGCPFHRQTCMFSSCLFGKKISDMRVEIKGFLESKTLIDCIRE
ncbi:MAG: Rrf2 family transcriptional regulator [Spirochaetales bacterium]|nr:Rrf2 family transcriptional regulator [Spirochaetales bacterium]